MTDTARHIIDCFYPSPSRLRDILLTHSRSVAEKALHIARAHPELRLDTVFLEDAAMLHDIGIVRCHAPAIECFGTEPYICHGVLGAEMVREFRLERHARVCERHTGAGLTREAIVGEGLPLPKRDFLPETLEEQVVCYADKFFSKTRLDREKTVEEAERSLMKFGSDGVMRFRKWTEMFG